MRLCDVGAAIQEVMESYEVEINGKVYQGMTSVASVYICMFVYKVKWREYPLYAVCMMQQLLYGV